MIHADTTHPPISAPAVLSPKPKLTILALLASDLAALALAALTGFSFWHLLNPGVHPSDVLALWPLLGAFVLVYALLGLYPAVGVHPAEELKHLTLGSSAVYLLLLLIGFLFKEPFLASRGGYVSGALLSLLFVPLGRALLRHAFAARAWWGVPVLVLGAGKTGALLIGQLRGDPGLGLKPVACLDDDPRTHGRLSGVEVVGPLSETARLARIYRVKHALIAMPGVHPSRLGPLIRSYAGIFPHLIIVPDMFGMASLNVRARDLGGVIGLHARQNLLLRHNRVAKRLLDLMLVIPACLFALPWLALCCLWIVLVSPGSPFYAQTREGYRGRPIRVWKLRTMHLDAEALLERHLSEHPEARLEWSRFFKLRHDPRLLYGAGLLRKLSLDELPQLFNVLKGEMSFVGPRPFPYYHLEQFGPEFRQLRTEAQPGITGLWQVSSRSEGDLRVQENLDSYYIQNWSLWLDLYLLARTPWAVLVGKGAY